jgi:hypothetical protein
MGELEEGWGTCGLPFSGRNNACHFVVRLSRKTHRRIDRATSNVARPTAAGLAASLICDSLQFCEFDYTGGVGGLAPLEG